VASSTEVMGGKRALKPERGQQALSGAQRFLKTTFWFLVNTKK